MLELFYLSDWRKNMKKLLPIVLSVIMLFTSCTSGGGETVMSLGNAKVSEGEYLYWMATYKARYLTSYTDIRDNPTYWGDTISDGSEMTNEELVNDLIRQNIKSNLVAMAMFAEEGLTLSESDKTEIDEYITSLIDERAEGSRKTFNAEIGAFGVNINMLRTLFMNEQKIAELYTYYYGENGKTPVTDADRQTYYGDNYVRFMQINVNDAFVYETDEDGVYIQDTDGTYKTRDLTDSEKAAKAKKIAEIDTLLADGGDVEELYADHSENTDYKNGYYFSSSTASDYVGEIVTKAFTLDIGQWTKITSADYGTFYIKRLELDEGGYANEENADFFDGFDDIVAQDLFDDLITSRFDDIVIDEALLNAVSVADVTANYYYY